MASEGQNKLPETAASPAAVPTVAAAYGNSDWAAVQAYYSSAMTASSPHPYVWTGQPMMSPYGTPVPFSPYHPSYYAHLPMGVSMGYTQGESEDKEKEKEKEKEGKKRSKGNSGNTPEKSKGSSGSGNNSSRSTDSGSEDSSETRDDEAILKQTSATKKRKHGNSGGESSSHTMALHTSSTPESSYKVKPRSASKLPVSAPGRTAVATPVANLNIGMDLWNTSHTNALALNSRPSDNNMPSRPVDERDLKRERRKQSNRESARRSRLRKQQECEDLGKKVAELNDENNTLKTDLDQLKKACEEMEAKNKQLMDDMVQTHGPGVLTTLGMNTCALNLVKSNENTKPDADSNGIIASGSGSGNTESASR
ncbi:hypothetical protein LUZ60_010527 [Juncus effusus]|nr:hypothetical protein LUZ60_010527 [Juncus effusus]